MPLLPFGSPPSHGGGTTSPLTTKGDLWGFSSVNARLPVGTDGYLLEADSAQTLGVGYSTRDANLNAHLLINTNGILIGNTTWPTSSGTEANMLQPQRLTLNGTYSPSLGSTTFYAPFLVNDQLTPSSSGGAYEIAMSSIRGTITMSDGFANEVATATDVGVEVHGTNHLNQIFGWGMGLVVANTTTDSVWGINSGLTVNSGATVTTLTAFRGAVINLGTITTCIGLDLKTLAGTTVWGLQVGNYQSYHQGPLLLGATAFPTTTTNGTNLGVTPVLVSSGTYTVTPTTGGVINAAWLLNDNITISDTGAVANTTYVGLEIAPTWTASDGRTDEVIYALSSVPTFAGTNTLMQCNALLFTNTVTGKATTAVGASGNVVVNGGTVTTGIGLSAGSFKFSGTFTTMIGLQLTSLSGATTTWGIQVGNYLNYFQGKSTFGSSGTPTNTIDIQGGLLNYLDSGGITYAATTAIGTPNSNHINVTTTSAIGNSTFTITAAKAGTPLYLVIVNDATAGRTITFSTGFRMTTGTLVGTASKQWIVHLLSDGTNFCEVSRSGPQ